MENPINIINQRNKEELEKSKKEINKFILEYDLIETLFYISKDYYISNRSNKFEERIELPIVNFLFNMYLKQKEIKTKKPLQKDIEKLKDMLINYCRAFRGLIRYRNGNNRSWLPEDNFLYLSQEQYILGLINPEIYPHQLEKKISSLFSNINKDFLTEFGFSPVSAYCFSRAIAHIYNKKFEDHNTNFLFTEDDIENFPKPFDSNFERNFPEKEREIFRKELNAYLENFSVKIGEGNPNYDSLLDEDISWRKPIIKTQSGYLGTNIHQIEYGIAYQLECLIKDKKESNKTLWKKYNNAKSEYAEDLAYRSFQKIFKDHVYKNLKYQYQGKDCELDILIEYDNKIILAEVKSGSLRPKAKTGNKKKLERDLKEVLGKAYKQAKRAADYILNTDKPIFYQGKKPINIKKSNRPEIFFICIGLENLMLLTQNLKTAKLQNLFKENQYLWAVNLLELEIILKHIEYPSLFLHYIKARLDAQKQEKQVIFTADELSYFGFYLTEGPCGGFNFSENYNVVFLPPQQIAPFDNYYCSHILDPNKKPKLNLDPRLRRFIEEWDFLYSQDKLFSIHEEDLIALQQNPELATLKKLYKKNQDYTGHSDIIYWLLYFNSPTIKKIFDLIENYIKDTEKNKRPHSLFLDAGAFCLTFHSYYQQEGLKEMMFSYGFTKKYEFKKDLLLSLGTYITPQNPQMINEIMILDFPYKNDPKMQDHLELLKKYKKT